MPRKISRKRTIKLTEIPASRGRPEISSRERFREMNVPFGVAEAFASRKINPEDVDSLFQDVRKMCSHIEKPLRLSKIVGNKTIVIILRPNKMMDITVHKGNSLKPLLKISSELWEEP